MRDRNPLEEALRKLLLMARTSGGTVGPDAGLMAACYEAEAAIARSEQAASGSSHTARSDVLSIDVVEQRLLTWRQRFMNKSGDRLALDDFMGQESIDDLIDFVCSPPAQSAEQGATPPAPAATIAALMEQAQVYASAWSLVGGRFDDGTFHAAAMTEKDALRGMLTAALAASPQPAAPVEIDYPAAIAYCYKKLGHAQGAKGCIAFARGAEWMWDQIASAQAAEGGAS